VIVFDHLKLVRRDHREVARYRAWLLGIQTGELSQIRVEHEADKRCCRRESWNKTQAALVEAMKPARPLVAINLNHGAMPVGETRC
jgi:hypothetical protein